MKLNSINNFNYNFCGVAKVSNVPNWVAKDLQNALNGANSHFYTKKQVENFKNLLKVKLKDYNPNQGAVVANSGNDV